MRTISFANSGPDWDILSGSSGWPGDHSPDRWVHPVLQGSEWLGDPISQKTIHLSLFPGNRGK